jgi:hypothetical protein
MLSVDHWPNTSCEAQNETLVSNVSRHIQMKNIFVGKIYQSKYIEKQDLHFLSV